MAFLYGAARGELYLLGGKGLHVRGAASAGFGHVGADFITLASMLRIPVCMHNVEETKVYRPSAWAAHGMDIEGQDYRACQNYGPLYKR